MNRAFELPEVTAAELAELLQQDPPVCVLDVREDWEIELASLGDAATVVPLSRLSAEGLEALPTSLRDKTRPIVVMCHHGVRSAQVTWWLIQNGYTNVRNLTGGIDEFAEQVDRSVGSY